MSCGLKVHERVHCVILKENKTKYFKDQQWKAVRFYLNIYHPNWTSLCPCSAALPGSVELLLILQDNLLFVSKHFTAQLMFQLISGCLVDVFTSLATSAHSARQYDIPWQSHSQWDNVWAYFGIHIVDQKTH